jgi:hypothetical protein
MDEMEWCDCLRSAVDDMGVQYLGLCEVARCPWEGMGYNARWTGITDNEC